MVVQRINILILLFILVPYALNAQNEQKQTFVRTMVMAKEVQLKQPFNFRITVYTDTWFSSAPNLDHIVIPGALTIKTGRALGGNETIDNQAYTSLSFEFIVFPGVTGELLIPAIDLNYSTPKSGDFKGIPVTRSTEPITLKVRQPPSEYDPSTWLVAEDVKLSIEWDKALTKLKVGDVLQRTILISARGTLAALLPASTLPDIEWGSVYAKSPVLMNDIGPIDISSTRTDITTFLLESPGEFEIPPVSLNWWQPSAGAVRSSAIKPQTIVVSENPDLAILQTLQDSLTQISANERGENSGTKLPWFPVAFLFVCAMVLLMLVHRSGTATIIRIWERVQSRRQAYLNSEACLFDRLKHCSSETDRLLFYNLLKAWVRRICPEVKGNLESFADLYGSGDLKDSLQSMQQALFYDDGRPEKRSDIDSLIMELGLARGRILNRHQTKPTHQPFRLNPG